MTEDPFDQVFEVNDPAEAAAQTLPSDLTGFVAESEAAEAEAAGNITEAREADRGRAVKHGRGALKGEQEAAGDQAALAASYRAGHVTPDTLAAHTEELAGQAESAEDFYASLAAADPDAVATGAPVKGALRGDSAYGTPDVVQDVDLTDPAAHLPTGDEPRADK